LDGRADNTTSGFNVLFIAVDDLNNDLGCYGHSIVKSPNVDRLAAKGVRFDKAYCQYPLCNPSRSSFLTGLRPEATRIHDNETNPQPYYKDYTPLTEYLHQHGYYTAASGKIAHNTFPESLNWDFYENPTHDTKSFKTEPSGRTDETEPDGKIAETVVRLLKENKEKRFFIAAGFRKPHGPLECPKKYFDMYPPGSIPPLNEPPEHVKNIPKAAINPKQLKPDSREKVVTAYYACISFMDAQLGLIMDAMDQLKLWDNTVVVFFSDHGWHLGEHGGMYRKSTLFEHVVRVPLIMVTPQSSRGATAQGIVELVDLFPTLTELCGIPPPSKLEGTSFASLLSHPGQPWKKAAFTTLLREEMNHTMGRSVRTDHYRYTEWNDEKTAELYDYQADPNEYVNLVGSVKHTQVLEEMKAMLRAGWQAAVPHTAQQREKVEFKTHSRLFGRSSQEHMKSMIEDAFCEDEPIASH